MTAVPSERSASHAARQDRLQVASTWVLYGGEGVMRDPRGCLSAALREVMGPLPV